MSGIATDSTGRQHKSSGYLRCAMVLVGAVGALFLLVSPLAIWQDGFEGFLEAGIAALVSLLSGVMALMAACHCVHARHPLLGMLLAMALRLLPPLVLCLFLALRGSGTEFFSLVCYLLAFYLITLAVETYLSVRLVQSESANFDDGVRTCK